MGLHRSRSTSARIAFAILSLVFGVVLLGQAPTTVRQGVYSAAQANRGGAVYEEKCTSCHASRMWGSDWTQKSLWDLYDTINNYMPEDNPGSLSPQQTRDVVAYILKTNKLPAGMTELPESADALKQIRLELPEP